MTRTVQVIHGDALKIIPTLDNDSVDAVVTDPPYALGFMGHTWDTHTPAGFQHWCQAWATECLRVLKPGGHLLAFGGTRTWHRLTSGIEDAGFEIRDTITWLYASGFPKSLDVSKAIDKVGARTGEDVALLKSELRRVFEASGMTLQELNVRCGFEASGYLRTSSTWATVMPTPEKWRTMRAVIGCDDDFSDAFRAAEREVIGTRRRLATGREGYGFGEEFADTEAATDAARRWAGWGTALKPASEPIVVARKPLAGTVAANVQRHGTGAINIDACRVPAAGRPHRTKLNGADTAGTATYGTGLSPECRATGTTDEGRWPTNVVLSHASTVDGDDACADGCVPGCPVAELDAQAGTRTSGRYEPHHARNVPRLGHGGAYGNDMGRTRETATYGDSGGASRFYPTFRYQPKAPSRERPKVDGTAHATVKPLALMRWLITLVTPPGGTVLDPFAGSGTTLEAAALDGFNAIGIEREADYLPLIRHRLDRVPNTVAIEYHAGQTD